MNSAADKAQTDAANDVVVAWSVHLGRHQPLKTAVALVSVCFVWGTGVLLFQNALAALLPAGALFFAVSEYLLPIHYRLTDTDVQARNGLMLLEMPWRDVRHVYVTDDALKISPLKAKNSRFEAWRGIWLRFGSEDREKIIETVRRLRDAAQTKSVSAETETVNV